MSRSRSLSFNDVGNYINIFDKFKRFCQYCTKKSLFWSIVGALTLVEPILCSKWPVGYIKVAQVVVLAASSLLYVIQLVGVASREWDKILLIEAMTSLSHLSIPSIKDFTLLKMLIFFTAEGEYILEFGCLVIGWVFIFWRPGLAALRCFRLFRLLWFYEVDVFRAGMERVFGPVMGRRTVSRAFKVLKFAIKSLTALGDELFRLSQETRGGLLLMMIFFYAAYVLGAALWVETSHHNEHCLTLGDCVFTLMRLTFFDGTGFDFAYSLTEKHRILFFIVMFYMCITAFGILNGLVGIFGTVIAKASETAFVDEDYDRDDDQQQLYDSNDGNDSNNNDSGKGIIAIVGANSNDDMNNGSNNGGNASSNNDNEVHNIYDDKDDDDDDNDTKIESVKKYEESNKIKNDSPNKKLSGEALGDKLAELYDSGASKFAFKNINKSNPRRTTLKDFIKSNMNNIKAKNAYQVSSQQEDDSSENGSPKIKNKPMFGIGGSAASNNSAVSGSSNHNASSNMLPIPSLGSVNYQSTRNLHDRYQNAMSSSNLLGVNSNPQHNASSSSGGGGGGFGMFGSSSHNPHRKNSLHGVATSSQHHHSSSVSGQDIKIITANMNNMQSKLDNQHDTIQKLKSKVDNQNDTINELTSQITQLNQALIFTIPALKEYMSSMVQISAATATITGTKSSRNNSDNSVTIPADLLNLKTHAESAQMHSPLQSNIARKKPKLDATATSATTEETKEESSNGTINTTSIGHQHHYGSSLMLHKSPAPNLSTLTEAEGFASSHDLTSIISNSNPTFTTSDESTKAQGDPNITSVISAVPAFAVSSNPPDSLHNNSNNNTVNNNQQDTKDNTASTSNNAPLSSLEHLSSASSLSSSALNLVVPFVDSFSSKTNLITPKSNNNNNTEETVSPTSNRSRTNDSNSNNITRSLHKNNNSNHNNNPSNSSNNNSITHQQEEQAVVIKNNDNSPSSMMILQDMSISDLSKVIFNNKSSAKLLVTVNTLDSDVQEIAIYDAEQDENSDIPSNATTDNNTNKSTTKNDTTKTSKEQRSTDNNNKTRIDEETEDEVVEPYVDESAAVANLHFGQNSTNQSSSNNLITAGLIDSISKNKSSSNNNMIDFTAKHPNSSNSLQNKINTASRSKSSDKNNNNHNMVGITVEANKEDETDVEYTSSKPIIEESRASVSSGNKNNVIQSEKVSIETIKNNGSDNSIKLFTPVNNERSAHKQYDDSESGSSNIKSNYIETDVTHNNGILIDDLEDDNNNNDDTNNNEISSTENNDTVKNNRNDQNLNTKNNNNYKKGPNVNENNVNSVNDYVDFTNQTINNKQNQNYENHITKQVQKQDETSISFNNNEANGNVDSNDKNQINLSINAIKSSSTEEVNQDDKYLKYNVSNVSSISNNNIDNNNTNNNNSSANNVIGNNNLLKISPKTILQPLDSAATKNNNDSIGTSSNNNVSFIMQPSNKPISPMLSLNSIASGTNSNNNIISNITSSNTNNWTQPPSIPIRFSQIHHHNKNNATTTNVNNNVNNVIMNNNDLINKILSPSATSVIASNNNNNTVNSHDVTIVNSNNLGGGNSVNATNETRFKMYNQLMTSKHSNNINSN